MKLLFKCSNIFSFNLYFGFYLCQTAKVCKIIGIVKGGRGYGSRFHNFMKKFIFMLAHVLLLHDLYNLFGHHVVIVLFWFFFTLKIHGRTNVNI